MSEGDAGSRRYLDQAVETTIRLGLVAALVAACLLIVWPFLVPVLWAVIIAIATFPLYARLRRMLGGRRKLAASLVVLAGMAILVVPAVLFLGSVTDGLVAGGKGMADGSLAVPPPVEGVEDWPLVGKSLHRAWSDAAENTPEFLARFQPQIVSLGGWLLDAAAGLGLGVLQFALSILISGAFLATAEGGRRFADRLGGKLAGERGTELVRVAGATVQSVAKGVLGVGVAQALLAGIGLFAAGVPWAGAWTLLVLVLAIVQLPTLLVMVPAAVWVFSSSGTTGAVVFAAWAIVVSLSDNVLRPLLLGRGVELPMLVILIGSIGGMISMGILGLFVGAVLLGVGYQVLRAWLGVEEGTRTEASQAPV